MCVQLNAPFVVVHCYHGNFHCVRSLSKVAYRAGDKAFVHIEIINNSAVEIRSFVLKVCKVTVP